MTDLEFDAAGPAGKIAGDIAGAFAESGVVCVRNLLSAEWIDFLRHAMERAIENPGAGLRDNPAGYRVENLLWQNHEDFRRFAFEGPVARAAGAIMASAVVRMFNDTMFVKEPNTDEPTPWHHDLPYFKLGGMQNCSVWIGLDPVTIETGAMSFVPGSHLWGKMFRPTRFGKEGGEALSDDGFNGHVPDIDADPGRYPTVHFDLMPGDVTFHHLLTLHKAGSNNSSHMRRRAHTMRMVGDDAVYIERPFASASFDTDLRDGDRLEGPPFPILWSAQDVAAADPALASA